MPFFSSNKTSNNISIGSNANVIIQNLKNNKYYEYCMKACFNEKEFIINDQEKICLLQCSDQVHNYLAANYKELVQLKGTL